MRSVIFAGLAVIAVSLTATPAADACVNATRVAPEEASTLRRAQNQMDQGEYESARLTASPVVGHSNEDLAEQAKWIVAMTYVRDRKADQSSLAGAVSTMRDIRGTRTLTDVKSRVDLGEALARVETNESKLEAQSLLEPLAREDLIGSDHAYAQLARIASTPEIRATALKRCETIAGDNSGGYCAQGFVESESESKSRAVIAFGLAAGAFVLALSILSFLRLRRQAKRMEEATLA